MSALSSPDASTTPAFDPLLALTAQHAETVRQCQALEGLAALSAAPARRGLDAQASTLLDYFEGPALHARRMQEQYVFPALIESMAGSDAVCLHDMTHGLQDERQRLDRIWHTQLRPVLLRLSAGEHIALDPEVTNAWVHDFQLHLQVTDQELLPMAARLLTDEALAEINIQWHKSLPPAEHAAASD